MNDITLAAVNARYSQSNLALRYLSAALNGTGDLIEWDINRSPRELLEKLIESGSTRFIFSAYIWNADYLKRLIPDLAALHPEAVICCGGPEAVYNSKEWRTITGLSHILDGNAEDFADIIPKLEKTKHSELLGISRRPFSETPFPYTDELLDKLKGRIIYYEASRGCLFNCSYCLSAVTDKNGSNCRTDYRSPEQIIIETKILSRFEGTVKFVDRTFNGDAEASRLIWRRMIENPPAGCFHFEIHPALLKEEDFALIKQLKPGTVQFEIGIQSTDEEVLRNVNRSGSWKLIKRNIQKLSAIKGHHIHLDQIIGLPGDTPKKAVQSFDDIISLEPDIFQAGFLKLLPGTPLAAEAGRYGIKASASPPYEVLQTAGFSFNHLRHFHRIEKLVGRLYNSGFFRHSLPVLAGPEGWYNFFNTILSDRPELTNHRWDYWGRILYQTAKKLRPENIALIKDLLRLDWCPFAGANRYPDYLSYSDRKLFNTRRSRACQKAGRLYPELCRSELNRAAFFYPESRSCLLPEKEPILFIKHRKKLLKISDKGFRNA